MNDVFAPASFALTRPPVAIAFDPAWYWHAVGKLAERFNRIPKAVASQDSFLAKTFTFHREYHGLDDAPLDRSALQQRFPEHFRALRLHQETDPHGTRMLIEAFILTGEMPEQIGQRVKCWAPVIAVYEKLFFDVRDLLKFRAFINTKLLRSEEGWAISGDYGLQCKQIAYAGGADMLARFIDPSADFTSDQQAILYQAIRKSIAKNAFEASLAIAVTPENAVDLQKLHMQLGQGAPKAQSEGGTDSLNDFSDAAEAIRSMIDWNKMFGPSDPPEGEGRAG